MTWQLAFTLLFAVVCARAVAGIMRASIAGSRGVAGLPPVRGGRSQSDRDPCAEGKDAGRSEMLSAQVRSSADESRRGSGDHCPVFIFGSAAGQVACRDCAVPNVRPALWRVAVCP
jgi:hypothetical protein